jgi:hypothetical protein
MATNFKVGTIILSRQTLTATGNDLYLNGVNVADGVGANLSGNLTQTGVALLNRDFLISGWLTTGIATSGQAAVNYANSIGVSTSGTIVLTGNAAVTHSNGMGTILSGNLTQTGVALINRDLLVSGWLVTGIANTGQAAVNYANSIGVSTSGTIVLTGSAAVTHANGIGTIISGNLTQTGISLMNRDLLVSGWLTTGIATSGSAAVQHANGIGSIISGNLTTTGQTLDTKINSLSGFVGNVSGGLEIRISATGNSAVTHANGIGINLSGNLTQTGITLLTKINSLSGHVDNVSGALQAQIAGGGSQVKVTGSATIAIPDFTGIGGTVVLYSGAQVFISGGAGGGGVSQGQLDSLSGYSDSIFVHRTGEELISGIKTFTTGVIVSGILTQGSGNIALGIYSHVEGFRNQSIGIGSHAEGLLTITSGDYSHAEGVRTSTSGLYSHAEGGGTMATGVYSHSEGSTTTAGGFSSHAEGGDGHAVGRYSHTEGRLTIASGENSHAEGYESQANGLTSHSEGNAAKAEGIYSHAEGNRTTAFGVGSHSEGFTTKASGDYAHSEGNSTRALSNYAHAEGNNTLASGSSSHSEGANTRAIGNGSHAEGSETAASGIYSHAEGLLTIATGSYSHAEGVRSSALATYAHAEGIFTVADRDGAHAQGLYNRSGVSGLFQVGRGTSESDRRDAIYISDTETNPSILSGEWITSATGTNNLTIVSYQRLTGISGALQAQVGGGGSQVKVSGSSNITIADFTGIGSAVVLYSGNQIFISGGAGGGGGTQVSITGSASMTAADFTGTNGFVTRRNGNVAELSAEYLVKTTGTQNVIINANLLNGATSLQANGSFSHSEGELSEANGNYSHAEGVETKASGLGSHTEGWLSRTSGDYSHAEGFGALTIGQSSHAEGYACLAYGLSAHAEGYYCYASGFTSHAEGAFSYSFGNFSHAEGYQTNAFGQYSHSEGYQAFAYADGSHAEGQNTVASGIGSHAEGLNNVALADYSLVVGRNAQIHKSGLFQVGKGTISNREDVIFVNSGFGWENPSILSGEWITSATGTNNSTIMNYSRTTGISGALRSLIGGGGSVVEVTGSAPIATADFSGINGCDVSYNGTQVLVSTRVEPLRVPFVTTAVTATNATLAPQFFAGSFGYVTRVDLTRYTGALFTVTKVTTAGAANSAIFIRYRGDANTTASNYLALTNPEMRIPTNNTNTITVSGFQPIVAAAKSGIYLALIASGGDGVLDPVFGNIAVNFL